MVKFLQGIDDPDAVVGVVKLEAGVESGGGALLGVVEGVEVLAAAGDEAVVTPVGFEGSVRRLLRAVLREVGVALLGRAP